MHPKYGKGANSEGREMPNGAKCQRAQNANSAQMPKVA